MIERIVFGHVRDGPLSEIIGHIQHFSDKELQIAELASIGKSDKEIAGELDMKIENVIEIQNGIKERVKQILRGY